MTERRFHRSIYDLRAVQGAVQALERFASMTLSDEGEHHVVRVTAKSPARERRVADELCNHALGLARREVF
ncbi:MAG: hypothetical protein IPN17_32595 [Deltaproteobacteria bacterium]|nr:hypothetical protein [Deltaproteobacteria bacterium]